MNLTAVLVCVECMFCLQVPFKLFFFWICGWFRYSVSERRWTQMLTSAVQEGSTPSPRYHHAASLLTSHEPGSGASHSFMLVVGGVTPNGVAMDTWSLNLSSLIWREHTVRIWLILELQNIRESEGFLLQQMICCLHL